MKVQLILALSLLNIACGLRTEKLVFQDDFSTFDFSKWKHEITMGGGGNWEFELYWNNRTTSFVEDGVLHIKPGFTKDYVGDNNLLNGYTIDFWGSNPANQCTGNAFYGCERTSGGGGNYLNPITSARLRSAESFAFKYGRLEVSAKLPKGDWLWPAIWMLPRHNAYGEWPASGEIDIVESRGNTNYPDEYDGGVDTFASTLHWGPAYGFDPWDKTHAAYKLPSGTFADEFHTFGLYWDENQLYTYVDNDSNKVLQVNFDTDFWTKGQFPQTMANPWKNAPKNAPFDQEYYIVFNVAVGGTADYFREGVAGKPWSNTSPHAVNEFWNARGAWQPTWGDDAQMQIDWIKVYQFEDVQEKTFLEQQL